MKKRVYGGLYIIVMLFMFSFMVATVSAHIIKTDGNIKALLHINPNDAPTSGTTSSLLLFFTDSSKQFTLSKCNCNMTIQEDGQTIDNKQLEFQYPNQSENKYIFPKSDVYTLEVTGQPKVANDFQPFTLSYTVRVERGLNDVNSKPFSPLIWIGMGIVISLILLAAIYQERSHKRDHKTKE